MDLNHLHLMVRDVARSRKFYEAMFGFKEKIWYGDDLLFLRNEHGFDLALSPSPNPEKMPNGVHYGFSVKEPRKLAEIYKQGNELYPECFPTEPKDYGDWGTLVCQDPDGYNFEIYWDMNLQ
jgi:catechol 2,3-dioxygenase-like lactoylglutathione lyase family enzyme